MAGEQEWEWERHPIRVGLEGGGKHRNYDRPLRARSSWLAGTSIISSKGPSKKGSFSSEAIIKFLVLPARAEASLRIGGWTQGWTPHSAWLSKFVLSDPRRVLTYKL
jgi:hypothetical protein